MKEFFLKNLTKDEITTFMKLNDNDFFEKLSDRVDIDEYSQKLYEKSLHFTLYDGDKLIGFSPCYFNDKRQGIGYISSLTIRDGYRRLGLGTYMLNKIKAYAQKNSFTMIHVSIHIDNQISSDFYKKNGFEISQQNRENSVSILKYLISKEVAMKVSDYIAEFLAQNEIDKVFSYIGKNAHLCDSIDKHEAIENVFTIHEQGAGFAADAYARVTGKTGVSTVTSGPGGTNLVTSIADCYFDGVPTMFIVGDLPPDECKGDKCIRQFGFQETDMVNISKPITKYSVAIDGLHDLRYKFEKAYYLSQEGRKGPVLISLPENLQFLTDFNPNEEVSFYESEEYKKMIDSPHDNIDHDVKRVVELINEAKRPVILIGGGARQSLNADLELKQFIDKTNIPIVYSLMGKDVIKHDYVYNLGFIGNFGNRYSNLTLANTDLLIVVGSRLDYLQTGRNIDTFAREAKIIQVDIDKCELGLRRRIDLPVLSDIKTFFKKLNKHKFNLDINAWKETVLHYKEKYPSEYDIDKKVIIGNKIISELSNYLRDDDIVCVDVGEHQMLVAQSLRTKGSQRVLFSGGFGAMGFALPAAIGSTLGTGRRVVVISGDGGFQMNIQELEVVSRRNLPIKMIIINNQSLHMVKLRQDTYLGGNYVGTIKDYSVPSFKRVGEAYGISGYQISSSNIHEIKQIIENSFKNDDSEIIDIQLEGQMTTVEPRLDFNRPFEDMRPYLDRKELEEQMVIRSKGK